MVFLLAFTAHDYRAFVNRWKTSSLFPKPADYVDLTRMSVVSPRWTTISSTLTSSRSALSVERPWQRSAIVDIDKSWFGLPRICLAGPPMADGKPLTQIRDLLKDQQP